MESNEYNKFKITFCGDYLTFKSSIIKSLKDSKYTHVNEMSVISEPVEIVIDFNGIEYNLCLMNTSGVKEYAEYRKLCYPNTNCFILCYSITNRNSFENILEKWIPEINNFSMKIPNVLVGTKIDERIEGSDKFVTTEEGLKLKEQIKAADFVECSSKNRENLNEILYAAINAIENKKVQRKKCLIM